MMSRAVGICGFNNREAMDLSLLFTHRMNVVDDSGGRELMFSDGSCCRLLCKRFCRHAYLPRLESHFASVCQDLHQFTDRGERFHVKLRLHRPQANR